MTVAPNNPQMYGPSCARGTRVGACSIHAPVDGPRASRERQEQFLTFRFDASNYPMRAALPLRVGRLDRGLNRSRSFQFLLRSQPLIGERRRGDRHSLPAVQLLRHKFHATDHAFHNLIESSPIIHFFLQAFSSSGRVLRRNHERRPFENVQIPLPREQDV